MPREGAGSTQARQRMFMAADATIVREAPGDSKAQHFQSLFLLIKCVLFAAVSVSLSRRGQLRWYIQLML